MYLSRTLHILELLCLIIFLQSLTWGQNFEQDLNTVDNRSKIPLSMEKTSWILILIKLKQASFKIGECTVWVNSIISFKFSWVIFSAIISEAILTKSFGGFQLLDLIITELKSDMICYNSMPLIGWNYSIQTGEKIM